MITHADSTVDSQGRSKDESDRLGGASMTSSFEHEANRVKVDAHAQIEVVFRSARHDTVQAACIHVSHVEFNWINELDGVRDAILGREELLDFFGVA
jgi:hypothetical protein